LSIFLFLSILFFFLLTFRTYNLSLLKVHLILQLLF